MPRPSTEALTLLRPIDTSADENLSDISLGRLGGVIGRGMGGVTHDHVSSQHAKLMPCRPGDGGSFTVESIGSNKMQAHA